MTKHNFTVRCAQDMQDCQRLTTLFDIVFAPEEVAKLAETLFEHHPHLAPENWLLIEDENNTLVAGCVLIPWQWQWFGMPIKVAEQGIVATHPDYRGQGLQRKLNKLFDQMLADKAFDLAIIQGIPGFYHQMGYHYSLPIDNHINLEWRLIPENTDTQWRFREATLNDIPFLVEQDKQTAASLDSANVRDEKAWQYMLTHSKQTEYGSDVWIGEHPNYSSIYVRRNYMGFGEGMIVSEATQPLSQSAGLAALAFLKQQNKTLEKPYLRLNLHNEMDLSKIAIGLGAQPGQPYGFQIKLPDIGRWLSRQKPLLERRLQGTPLADYSGRFRFEFYTSQWDIVWQLGKIEVIETAQGEADESCNIPSDLAPALLLGRHTLRELRATRPDIFATSPTSEALMDVWWPAVTSWHHLPY